MTSAPHMLVQLVEYCIGFVNPVILDSDKKSCACGTFRTHAIDKCMAETIGIRARRGVGSGVSKVVPLRITWR